tara:strand:- start:428 stop:997 length:570 start_codon:yes stop_codon:yes gene_type:complete
MKKVIHYHHLDHPDREYLLSQIDKYKSKDQGLTSVILTAADCNVYQPYYRGSKFEHYEDFERVRKDLVPWVRNLLKDNRYWIPKSCWALDYENGEGAWTHTHHNTDYSLIWYLRADEGCATIEFFDPDVSIQPTEGMALLFLGSHKHGVLPNIDINARRTCLVFDIVKMEDAPKKSQKRGFYDIDEEFL